MIAHRRGALSISKVEFCHAGEEGFVAQVAVWALVAAVVPHWLVAPALALLVQGGSGYCKLFRSGL